MQKIGGYYKKGERLGIMIMCEGIQRRKWFYGFVRGSKDFKGMGNSRRRWQKVFFVEMFVIFVQGDVGFVGFFGVLGFVVSGIVISSWNYGFMY